MGALFSGRNQGSSGRKNPPARRNSSSDGSNLAPSRDSAFFGEHFEGLGDVWAAMLPGGTKELVKSLNAIFERSSLSGRIMHRKDGTCVRLYASPSEGGISLHSQLVSDKDGREVTFVGGYPAFEGTPADVRIDQAHIWKDGISGVVAASDKKLNAPLNFYLASFFQHVPDLRFGSDARFSLSALAFEAEKVKDTGFRLEPGMPAYEVLLDRFLDANPGAAEADFVPPVFDSHGQGFITPTDYVGIWSFQLPVLGVERVAFMGHPVCRIDTCLYGEGEKSVGGVLYAAEHVLKGLAPRAGDDLSGILWMQGEMLS